MSRIALISNTDFSLYNFRLGLIRELIAEGFEVHVVCPGGEYAQEFTKMGLAHHSFYIDRRGTNPINEARTLWQLYRIFRNSGLDIVHNFTPKVNIYGNLAARLAGVPTIVNSVTGLGYVFTESDLKTRLLRRLVTSLYRFGFRFSKRVIFLNEDDFGVFERNKIVDKHKGVLLRSEGVNTRRFCPEHVSQDGLGKLRRELGIPEHGREVIVTLISRLLWSKGIREFIDMARVIRAIRPDVVFLLVGPIDTGNPDAVSEQFIRQAEHEGLIKYLGKRRDIPEILHISDIVTLPSFYREGIPTVLLEAMSMGKPIVTTDSVGCKEVVEEGKNGFLVPVRDHTALASAVERLIDDEELRMNMGRYGRQKAIREFDERIIIGQTIRIYEELLGSSKRPTVANKPGI